MKIQRYPEKNQELLRKNLPSYGAVIFDEVHFFTADADFNAYTLEALLTLIPQFVNHDIPRLYLTGTPDDVFDSVWRTEWTAQHDRDPLNRFQRLRSSDEYHSVPILHHFHFQRDYHYLNLFVLNKEEIADKIQNSSEKWIVFVESKQHGERLAERLGKRLTVFTLDSSTLHDKRNDAAQQFLQRLSQDEELDADVLIATKCLDVGVTIKTKNINIVCFLTDKTDFLQSIGRKRANGKESVNLFVPRYSIKDVNHWIAQTRETLHEYTILQQTCKEGALANGSSFPCPIYIRNGRYCFNDLAVIKLRNRRKRLEALLKEIAQSDDPDEVVIANHFASWLGKDAPLNHFIPDSDAKKNELKAIITPYLGVTMDEIQYRSLCEALRPFDPRTDVRASRSEITTQTVNKILSLLTLGIKRSKCGNKPIFQVVEKGN